MGWLPGFLLRRLFSREDLKSRIHIDVRNRPFALQLNGGDFSEAAMWIVIQNNGYFPIELDRLTATLHIGVSLDFFSLDRVWLPPDASHEIFVRGPLNPGTIAFYKLNKKNAGIVVIDIRAEFNSKIHNFSYRTGNISSFAINAINM